MINFAKCIYHQQQHQSSKPLLPSSSPTISILPTAAATTTTTTTTATTIHSPTADLLLMKTPLTTNESSMNKGQNNGSIFNDIHSLASSSNSSNEAIRIVQNGLQSRSLFDLNGKDGVHNNNQQCHHHHHHQHHDHGYKTQTKPHPSKVVYFSTKDVTSKRVNDKKRHHHHHHHHHHQHSIKTTTTAAQHDDDENEEKFVWNNNNNNNNNNNADKAAVEFGTGMMQQFIRGIDSSLMMNLFSDNKLNSLQEINLRLLILTIQWIKNMPLFIRLDINDQRSLFRDSWKELYIINLAHWTMTMNAVTSGDHFEQTVQTYLNSLIDHFDFIDPMDTNHHNNKHVYDVDDDDDDDFIDDKSQTIADHHQKQQTSSIQMLMKHKISSKLNIKLDIENIKQVIDQFKQLQLDGTECGCLKSIALFNPECRHLINKQDLLKLQEQAQCLLINYTNRKFKLQNHNGSMAIDGTSGHKEFGNRFEQILMMLPLLKRISIESIEDIFFHNLKGPLSIQVLIECIYNQ
nr:protein dissatisfaction-like [Dermatophagoides farinae]